MLPTIIENIKEVPTQELKDELQSRLNEFGKNIAYMAKIYKELENRGVDLSHVRSGIGQFLFMVANEYLDARAVTRFAGAQFILKRLMKLPLQKQGEVLELPTVSVIVHDSMGRAVTNEIKLDEIDSKQIDQLFSDDGIRTPEEQIEFLSTTNQRTAVKLSATAKRNDYISINSTHRTIQIGSNYTELKLVIAKISEFYGKDIALFLREELFEGVK